MFDDKKEVTLTGVVKEFQYTNPHSWLLVDVKGPDGTVTTWGFEAEGPSSLSRAGIRLKDFMPGTLITITGHPMERWPAGGYMDQGDAKYRQEGVCAEYRFRDSVNPPALRGTEQPAIINPGGGVSRAGASELRGGASP